MFLSTLFIICSWILALLFPHLLLPSFVPLSGNIQISAEQKFRPISLLAVGDIMLDRYVETLIKKEGVDYPFAKTASLLANHDVVLGNLEGPVFEERKQTDDNSMTFSFDPRYVSALKSHHFSILNLANNHTFDHGKDAFAETKQQVQNANLLPLGHPREIAEVNTIIQTIQGKVIGFVGFNATKLPFEQEKALSLLDTLRAKTDLLIVTIHWGNEYALTPNQFQKNLAHAFIDHGADAVIGHHPHVVQSIEKYKDKVIFYSLGNFIFDQYFSPATQEELAIEAMIDDSQIIYLLHPLISIKSQPQEMPVTKKDTFLKDLAKRSDPQLSDAIINGVIVTP